MRETVLGLPRAVFLRAGGLPRAVAHANGRSVVKQG